MKWMSMVKPECVMRIISVPQFAIVSSNMGTDPLHIILGVFDLPSLGNDGNSKIQLPVIIHIYFH
ncbi:unnamed protein product [Hymenolepis diminuta]|uniref:Uncharacterized protein n=1 Tax=Hymenolepis diminuta TaxID=6216 RepID=A0A564YZ68_HYMDI|nr:unnamed protein product [Hymenolepis diminuta]